MQNFREVQIHDEIGMHVNLHHHQLVA